MTWIVLALGTAVFQAVKDVFLKRALRATDPILAVFGYSLAASVLFGLAAWREGIPPIGPGFAAAFVPAAILCAITLVMYITALRASDLSLTLPMLTFTPIFMMLTSPVMTGEYPGAYGIAGIVLIVSGSYLLNIASAKKGALAPFKALLHERGPRIMLMVALIWSVSGNLDKIGLLDSSPLFWIATLYATIPLFLSPRIMRAVRRDGWPSRRDQLNLALAGVFEAVSLGLQMYALTMAIVPYVIAVKRMSVIVGVILGAVVFRERGLRGRLAGSLLMVAGVFCIAFFG